MKSRHLNFILRFIFFLINLIFITHFVSAQNKSTLSIKQVDSISVLLNSIYQTKDWAKIAKQELATGTFFYDNKLYTPAIQHTEASAKASIRIHDKKGLLNAYSLLGRLYNYQKYGENSKSLAYFLKAYELADSLGEDEMAYTLLGNIGSIYSLEKRYDEGLKYLFLAIDRLKTLDMQKNIGVFYGNIANVYVLKNNYDSAYFYFKLSNKICTTTSDTLGLSRNYINLANLSIREKKYDNAMFFLDQSFRLSLRTNNLFAMAIYYKLMAKTFLFKKNYQKAEQFATRSLELGRKIHSSNRIMSAYKLFWKINEEKQNYKEALKYLSIYKSMNDSLEQQKEEDKITSLISNFETLQNLHQIKLLRAENSLKESQLENKNNQLRFIIIITLIILFSGVIFVWLFLKKKKAYLEILRKNIELEKKEKTEEEMLQNKPQSKNDVDMELIASWNEKIVQTGFFKNQHCSIELCAQELNTNRSYLSKAINQFYEQNFNSVINELRIKDARKILRQKDAKKYTIEYIAQQVGFNNKVSFSSSFKKITGLTPAFYRDNAPLVDNNK